MAGFSGGSGEKESIQVALDWFATSSGDATAFWKRLLDAQQRYRAFVEDPKNLGRDPSLSALGPDVVGAFLAQGKSRLDDRASYDLPLASRTIPWIHQIGSNVGRLGSVPGAADRAKRMLKDQRTEPDGPLLELVVAGNYAAEDFNVAFVEEVSASKTPDLHLSLPGIAAPMGIECKRLRRGDYETGERNRNKQIFKHAAAIIHAKRLSLHIDVNYARELGDVPDSYLAERLERFLASPLVMLESYPWKDEFGSGEIRPANLPAVKRDIADDGPLYFGPKMARLLTGSPVRENSYQMAANGEPDSRDRRFMEKVYFASVLTWQCSAAAAIESKAKHIKKKLAEADSQLKTVGVGIIHMAMDVELGCESSDLRRERNKEKILEFQSESLVAALYVHYLVPRISEAHSWVVDETVDKYGAHPGVIPTMNLFPAAVAFDNDLPAWKQVLPLSRSTSQ